MIVLCVLKKSKKRIYAGFLTSVMLFHFMIMLISPESAPLFRSQPRMGMPSMECPATDTTLFLIV